MLNPRRAARSLWLPALLASLALVFWACRSRPAHEPAAGPGQPGSPTAAISEAAALAAVAASVGDATPVSVHSGASVAGEPPTPPERLVRAPSTPSYLALSWVPGGRGSPPASYEVLRGDVVVATPREPSVHFTDLAAGRDHCFTVVAVDAKGARSAPSAPLCAAVPDLTPPAAPAGLTARLATPTQVTLTWQAATDDVGVVGYEVERDGTVVASTKDLSAGEGRLRAAQRACYAVRALDAAGNRSPLGEPVCVDPPDVTPPIPPTTVVAVGGPGLVALKWSGATDDVGVSGYEVLNDEVVVARVAGPAAQLSGLHAAVEHCYRVQALDAAGHRSPPSAPACATPPDVTPPRPPAFVTVKGASETELAITIAGASDDVGVTGYEVVANGAVAAAVAASPARVGGLTAGTSHCFNVVALDSAGNRSVASAEACGTTLDLTPPSAPRDVVAVVDGEHAATVRWSPSTDNVGVARYALRRDQSLVAESDATSTAMTDRGLRAARRYCFTVVAFDLAGNGSGAGGPACVTTPDLTPPTPPPSVAAAPSSPTQLVLAWLPSQDEGGVAGYEVRRGDAFEATVKSPTMAEPNLEPATEYCYTVRAFDAAGNFSEPSAPKCGKTAPPGTVPGPWNLQAQLAAPNELELTWNASPRAGVTYVVFWDGKGGGEARIGATPRTKFKVFGKVASEPHCYKVVAEDEEKNLSPKSFPACAGTGSRLSSR